MDLLLVTLLAVASDHLSWASRWVMNEPSSEKEESSSDYNPAHYSDLNKAGSCCKLPHDIWVRILTSHLMLRLRCGQWGCQLQGLQQQGGGRRGQPGGGVALAGRHPYRLWPFLSGQVWLIENKMPHTLYSSLVFFFPNRGAPGFSKPIVC